jgi:hypothetical protein
MLVRGVQGTQPSPRSPGLGLQLFGPGLFFIPGQRVKSMNIDVSVI